MSDKVKILVDILLDEGLASSLSVANFRVSIVSSPGSAAADGALEILFSGSLPPPKKSQGLHLNKGNANSSEGLSGTAAEQTLPFFPFHF